jgi:hypothetical protein
LGKGKRETITATSYNPNKTETIGKTRRWLVMVDWMERLDSITTSDKAQPRSVEQDTTRSFAREAKSYSLERKEDQVEFHFARRQPLTLEFERFHY